MTSFFIILFIIIAINAVMMVFSLRSTNEKTKKSSTELSTKGVSQMHSIDLISSKYKKAV